jgi:hypothetical protein
MNPVEIPQLTYQGRPLDMSPEGFGLLRRSHDVLGDRGELWRRMEEDGYLFLPGLLNGDEVMAARQVVCDRLAAAGILDERFPPIEGVVATQAGMATGTFMPQLARHNPALDKVLYDGPMMEFYQFFLGGPVRHFDYTWFRSKKPGTNTVTNPHCDIVYMGRGTHNLYTSWTPLGDVPFEMGGLMVLEGSHQIEELVQGYGQTDVDRYCDEGLARQLVQQARSAGRELTAEERQQIRWNSTGSYSADAIGVRQSLGGRWLTAEYRMGDLLVFCMHLMHASSDNQSDRIRLSSDSRYQLAAEPVDERWIGEDPPAHGIRAKQGMIC